MRDAEGWQAAETAADAIAKRWQEPDAGVWEIDPDDWTHSRLICAAGLRAISARHPAGERIAGWLTLADRITADTAAKALHRSGRRQRSPGDERLDAALLLVAIRGAIPPTIPARSRPWPRSSTAWSRMATATATVPTSDCLAGQKGRLCYAGS